MYITLVYAHVLSAFLTFAFWFVEWLAAPSPQGKNIRPLPSRFKMISMLMVMATGFYLMHRAWQPQPWLVSSVVLFLSTIPVSLLISRKLRSLDSESVNHRTINFVNNTYKLATAVAVLTLMVFKDGSYIAVTTKALICYLLIGLIANFRMRQIKDQ